MSIYTAPPQSANSAAPVPGQVLLEYHAIDDAERIKAEGLQCLGRLHGDLTWDDWLGVGAALEVITAEALAVVGAFKWESNNKRAVCEFNARWDLYEYSAGVNHKPLSKQERCALREVMVNPEISAWRSTLTGPEKRRLNHPNAVINRFKAQAKAKATPAETRKPSPFEQLKAANVGLQEELHQLKKSGDGNLFSKNDTPKAIATVIVRTFDGLGNKTAKVKAIVRELSAWVKAQKMAAS